MANWWWADLSARDRPGLAQSAEPAVGQAAIAIFAHRLIIPHMDPKDKPDPPGKDEQKLLDQEAFQRFFRESYGQVCALLVRRFGDLDLAQEALQEAFVVALAKWQPGGDRPQNIPAWLYTIARQKAIDLLRRERIGEAKQQGLLAGQQLFGGEPAHYDDLSEYDGDQIPDERLRLIFTCCHPALSLEARIALTLHTVCGLSTVEIAAAFLARETAIAQRIVRAKRKIRDAGVPFRIPASTEASERLLAVQHVLYLIFNEGYSAHTGADLIRSELCFEAIRLAGVLARLLPGYLSVHAQLALFCLQASRLSARLDADGRPLTLEFQDRRLWNRELIHQGCGALDHALAMSESSDGTGYLYQAMIAAEHAVAPDYAQTNWTRIATHYESLYQIQPTPVVRLNAAVAIGMARGAAAGLAHMDAQLAQDLDAYHWYHLSRAELLLQSGDSQAAVDAFRRAAAACENAVERAFIQERLRHTEAATE